MTKEQLIVYWVDSSAHDYRVAENLLASRDYVWALFLGHLVIEKLLKAYYVKMVSGEVPRTHNLPRLAERCGLETTEAQVEFLDVLTEFNIRSRYPDYKNRFYKTANKAFTLEQFGKN